MAAVGQTGSQRATADPGSSERFDRELRRRRDVRIDRHVEAEAGAVGDLVRPRGGPRSAFDRHRVGIAAIGAGHDLERQRDIGHGRRDRRDHRQADERFGEPRPVGDRAERRLEAYDPDVGRRPPARAAGIGADRKRHHASGDRHGRAARRATGRQARIHRVAGRPEQLIGGVALGRELRRVRHADDDSAGATQPLERDRVGRRPELREQPGALGHPPAGDPDVVLDGDRHAGQRQDLAGRDPIIDQPCIGAHARGIELDQRVQSRIDPPDPFEGLVDHRERGPLAAAHGLGDAGDGPSDHDRAPWQVANPRSQPTITSRPARGVHCNRRRHRRSKSK